MCVKGRFGDWFGHFSSSGCLQDSGARTIWSAGPRVMTQPSGPQIRGSIGGSIPGNGAQTGTKFTTQFGPQSVSWLATARPIGPRGGPGGTF